MSKADNFLDLQTCDQLNDEIEPLIRNLAAVFEARLSEFVQPRADDVAPESIGRIVAFEMRDIQRQLALLDKADKLYTYLEVASLLSISENSVKKLADGGRLKRVFLSLGTECRQARIASKSVADFIRGLEEG